MTKDSDGGSVLSNNEIDEIEARVKAATPGHEETLRLCETARAARADNAALRVEAGRQRAEVDRLRGLIEEAAILFEANDPVSALTREQCSEKARYLRAASGLPARSEPLCRNGACLLPAGHDGAYHELPNGNRLHNAD